VFKTKISRIFDGDLLQYGRLHPLPADHPRAHFTFIEEYFKNPTINQFFEK